VDDRPATRDGDADGGWNAPPCVTPICRARATTGRRLRKGGGLAEPRASCAFERGTQALDLAAQPIALPLQVICLPLQLVTFFAQALVFAPLAFDLALESFTLRIRRAINHALVMPELSTTYKYD
jgi:hypothetical protein